MNELKDFFAASVGAAGALIGLLFVAVSLGPEMIFGSEATATRRGTAMGAFVALGNVFFVSLAALIPRSAAQAVAIIAVVSIVQVAQFSVSMSRLYPNLRGWRRFGLISLTVYLLELAVAVRLLTSKDAHADGLAYVVIGLYGYALGASWDLLGARAPAKK